MKKRFKRKKKKCWRTKSGFAAKCGYLFFQLPAPGFFSWHHNEPPAALFTIYTTKLYFFLPARRTFIS